MDFLAAVDEESRRRLEKTGILPVLIQYFKRQGAVKSDEVKFTVSKNGLQGRKMERWRDGEMERWRDGEMERWRDGEMERWRDGEMERWRDRATERQGHRCLR
jgi:hypothetical protein